MTALIVNPSYHTIYRAFFLATAKPRTEAGLVYDALLFILHSR